MTPFKKSLGTWAQLDLYRGDYTLNCLLRRIKLTIGDLPDSQLQWFLQPALAAVLPTVRDYPCTDRIFARRPDLSIPEHLLL